MEAVGRGGGGGAKARRSCREASPDRAARACQVQPKVRPFRKVQVVYYLCRNGQLEQPHFMEVAHLPNQHLRLKGLLPHLSFLYTYIIFIQCRRLSSLLGPGETFDDEGALPLGFDDALQT